MVIKIYILPEMLGLLSDKLWQPKIEKLRRNFRQLGDLFASISGTKQRIIKRKAALKIAISPARADLIG